MEDGDLKETLMPLGQKPLEGVGTVIGQVSVFRPQFLSDNLLEIEVTDQLGQTGYRYYHFSV